MFTTVSWLVVCLLHKPFPSFNLFRSCGCIESYVDPRHFAGENDRLRRRRWSPGESPSLSRSPLQRFHLRSELELSDFHWIFRFLFDFSDCCRTIHCTFRASRRLMMLSSSTTSSIARSMSLTNEVCSLCDHAHFDYWFFYLEI